MGPPAHMKCGETRGGRPERAGGVGQQRPQHDPPHPPAQPPGRQRLGPATANTTPQGPRAAAAVRTHCPDAAREGTTGGLSRAPVKKPQPAGTSHGGQGGCRTLGLGSGAASLCPLVPAPLGVPSRGGPSSPTGVAPSPPRPPPPLLKLQFSGRFGCPNSALQYPRPPLKESPGVGAELVGAFAVLLRFKIRFLGGSSPDPPPQRVSAPRPSPSPTGEGGISPGSLHRHPSSS